MVTLSLPSPSIPPVHLPPRHSPCLASPSTSQSCRGRNRRLSLCAVSKEGEEDKEAVPSWANPGSEEPPPWARNEEAGSGQELQVPFYVYLLASAITAIAAIGSVFEYINQKPVFGVLESDSIFYAPVLGFFAFTGIPTSGFLWFKSVEAANKEAEEQDRRDGFL